MSLVKRSRVIVFACLAVSACASTPRIPPSSPSQVRDAKATEGIGRGCHGASDCPKGLTCLAQTCQKERWVRVCTHTVGLMKASLINITDMLKKTESSASEHDKAARMKATRAATSLKRFVDDPRLCISFMARQRSLLPAKQFERYCTCTLAQTNLGSYNRKCMPLIHRVVRPCTRDSECASGFACMAQGCYTKELTTLCTHWKTILHDMLATTRRQLAELNMPMSSVQVEDRDARRAALQKQILTVETQIKTPKNCLESFGKLERSLPALRWKSISSCIRRQHTSQGFATQCNPLLTKNVGSELARRCASAKDCGKGQDCYLGFCNESQSVKLCTHWQALQRASLVKLARAALDNIALPKHLPAAKRAEIAKIMRMMRKTRNQDIARRRKNLESPKYCINLVKRYRMIAGDRFPLFRACFLQLKTLKTELAPEKCLHVLLPKKEYARYLTKLKTIEVTEALDKIVSGAKAYFRSDHYDKRGNLLPKRFAPRIGKRHHGVNAVWTPRKPCCRQRDKKCHSNAKTWKAPPWPAFSFSLKGPHYYQYRFIAKGSNRKATFVLQARGDLDCDGIYSSYEVRGSINDKFEIVIRGPSIKNGIE